MKWVSDKRKRKLVLVFAFIYLFIKKNEIYTLCYSKNVMWYLSMWKRIIRFAISNKILLHLWVYVRVCMCVQKTYLSEITLRIGLQGGICYNFFLFILFFLFLPHRIYLFLQHYTHKLETLFELCHDRKLWHFDHFKPI